MSHPIHTVYTIQSHVNLNKNQWLSVSECLLFSYGRGNYAKLRICWYEQERIVTVPRPLTAAGREPAGKARRPSVRPWDEDLLWQMMARSACRLATGRTWMWWHCSTPGGTAVWSRPYRKFRQNSFWCSLPSTPTCRTFSAAEKNNVEWKIAIRDQFQ